MGSFRATKTDLAPSAIIKVFMLGKNQVHHVWKQVCMCLRKRERVCVCRKSLSSYIVQYFLNVLLIIVITVELKVENLTDLVCSDRQEIKPTNIDVQT